MNKVKTLGLITVLFSSLTSFASEQVMNSVEVKMIEVGGKTVYEDKVDVSYLSKMVIHPTDDWIGKKVFKYNGACIEIFKELQIKEIKDPFKNLYRSANLPKKVEIGVMRTESEVVDCTLYESKVTILE